MSWRPGLKLLVNVLGFAPSPIKGDFMTRELKLSKAKADYLGPGFYARTLEFSNPIFSHSWYRGLAKNRYRNTEVKGSEVVDPKNPLRKLRRRSEEIVQATLVHYVPGEDPAARLPDRVLPDNIRPGGGVFQGRYHLLGEEASPDQVFPPLSRRPGALGEHEKKLEAYKNGGSGGAGGAGESGGKVDGKAGGGAGETGKTGESAGESDGGQVAASPGFAGPWLSPDPSAVKLCKNWAKPPRPHFALLYIHGWNDYFFQTHLARVISALGGAFYAIDLHRYGRSWQEGQAFGYMRDVREYDLDIASALTVIRSEHPGLPLALMGHSTGGLIATHWAGRHPGVINALLLNSPWLANDVFSGPLGEASQTGALLAASTVPMVRLPRGMDVNYGISLDGWDEALSGPLPKRLEPFITDPSVAGWGFNPLWRLIPTAPIRLGWVGAVARAHTDISRGLTLDMPTLAVCANAKLDPRFAAECAQANAWAQDYQQRRFEQAGRELEELASEFASELSAGEIPAGNLVSSASEQVQDAINSKTRQVVDSALSLPLVQEQVPVAIKGWREECRHTDSAINADLIAQVARKKLFGTIEVHQISGVHDLTLSQPFERAQYWQLLAQFIGQHLPRP